MDPVDAAISLPMPGTNLALFAGDMIINGFLPISDISDQEGLDRTGADQVKTRGGNFSALLFLNLSAFATKLPRTQEHGTGSQETVLAKSDGIVQPAFAQNAETRAASQATHDGAAISARLINQVMSDFASGSGDGPSAAKTNVTFELSSPEPNTGETFTQEHGNNGSIAQNLFSEDQTSEALKLSEGANFVIYSQAWQGVSPQGTAERLADGAIDVTRVNREIPSGQKIWADLPRASTQQPENSALDSVGSKESVFDGNIRAYASPSMMGVVAEESMPPGQAILVGERLGKRNAASMDRIKATEDSNALASQPRIADRGQPRQGQEISHGYSIYAKDNLGQAISAIAREGISPRELGHQHGVPSHLELEGESHGRTMSQLIRTIGEGGSPDSSAGEPGTPFHQSFHDPGRVTLEAAHHGRVPFNLANLANNTPAAAPATDMPRWRTLLDHVIGEIKGHVRIGKSEAVLRLDPPELGSLKIDLHLEGDKLEARIVAETQEARTLIETRLPELRQALSEGLIDRVEVHIDSGNWSQGRGDGQQRPWREADGGRPWTEHFETTREGQEERESPQRQSMAHDKGRMSMWA